MFIKIIDKISESFIELISHSGPRMSIEVHTAKYAPQLFYICIFNFLECKIENFTKIRLVDIRVQIVKGTAFRNNKVALVLVLRRPFIKIFLQIGDVL